MKKILAVVGLSFLLGWAAISCKSKEYCPAYSEAGHSVDTF
ncbi:MAG: hypothetical protein N2110_00580 [Flavobacteriales bacterium]|nr:hypothetical protein [Flavobacteriales bacterium]MCX7767505.1 hypothetical protein [Flavobacteriales bacterium]MDW8409640.1 hypothetical protein [Flavobacteriales bacterium]